MSNSQSHAVFNAIFADNSKSQSLVAVYIVYSVACLILFILLERNKSGFLSQLYGGFYRFTFCL